MPKSDQSLVGFNNAQCRRHAALFGEGAFYDLDPTRHAEQAKDLRVGQECIVATPLESEKTQIAFDWFSFEHQAVKRDDKGDSCRVFFGKLIKSETCSKADAARGASPYSRFFNRIGHFKEQSTIWLGTAPKTQSKRVDLSDEEHDKSAVQGRTNENELADDLINIIAARNTDATTKKLWSMPAWVRVCSGIMYFNSAVISAPCPVHQLCTPYERRISNLGRILLTTNAWIPTTGSRWLQTSTPRLMPA